MHDTRSIRKDRKVSLPVVIISVLLEESFFPSLLVLFYQRLNQDFYLLFLVDSSNKFSSPVGDRPHLKVRSASIFIVSLAYYPKWVNLELLFHLRQIIIQMKGKICQKIKYLILHWYRALMMISCLNLS